MSFLGPELVAWGYSLLLLFLGFVLVLLEIFVIPGLNIFGILGFGTVLVGIWYAYAALGTAAASLVAVVGAAGTALLVRLLVRNRAWQRMVLSSRTSREEGYDSAPQGLAELVGQVGRASTPLRPSGRVLLGERSIDVVSEGNFIEAGCAVEVIKVRGNRVVVQALT